MDTVNIIIDGIKLEVPKEQTVLESAKIAGIHIPTLCFLKDINEVSSCRACLVEAGPRLLPSCTLKVSEGMEIKTNTPKVREARRTVVELLLSNHKRDCTTCNRSGKCELQSLAEDLNIRSIEYEGEMCKTPLDISSTSLVRDAEKCILCGRCISACNTVQTVGAIHFSGRGFETKVAPSYNRPLGDSICINCGQCINACPTGALHEKENIRDVWEAIMDEDKYVVVQTAPAVRVALGEEFGMPIGTRSTGKMVTALRRMGFDKVFDTDFAADLTIMEEGTELLGRINNGGILPLMTSCCPGWIKFAEHNFSDFLDNLSTCKSPHEMEGALIKSYFAKKSGINAKNIVVVSVMPCVAKKFENQRKELSKDKLQDVDIVITTRELAQMIKESSMDFVNLQEDEFDNPLGESTGAAVIFGVTGGVAEAALRTIFEITGSEKLEKLEFNAVRGVEGVKENTIELPNGAVINTAVISGLGNARKVMEMIRNKQKEYHFIEVMACPGGCVTGGGQPIVNPKKMDNEEVSKLRARATYDEDEAKVYRKSHENPHITAIYEEFLEKPNSHKAHELLHTHYVDRGLFNKK
ncbi:NADH-dependent [FeFe] hydrogenase, group A6 [Clostridium grantii]|uniref:NADH-quinone oxidoreductase subunit G n=1 Tax=Clostridium grantii DSM 8605 TaxID=1121316 RepID=A0A1M5XD29_9CLOT|nr:NADH-dependent [FeFe] hydrogenase, group A6 [Clostridium grantii]SHH97730.1 NADH-quinone oxidoreductase subunit G [Clostridium grantii DSM 8605]